MFAALKRDRPELDPAKLDRTRLLMGSAVRDWKVTGNEPLTDALKLPYPDDRHVLAAAIRARSTMITVNGSIRVHLCRRRERTDGHHLHDRWWVRGRALRSTPNADRERHAG